MVSITKDDEQNPTIMVFGASESVDREIGNHLPHTNGQLFIK